MGFTVLSMSLSLIAVFVPILFMGGIVGRIFHEFAFVLTTSIAVSMLVSLTVTPMMCSQLLKPVGVEAHIVSTAPVNVRSNCYWPVIAVRWCGRLSIRCWLL